MKKKIDLSPNYSRKARKSRNIKFVIFHYTGMQSEIESLKRLKNKRSKVSCHYFIKRNGKISILVNDNNIAWHAGKSKWKNFKNLNHNSIGIELVNKGHKFGYQNFPNLQIKSLIKLCKDLRKKYKIKKSNFLGHSDIAPKRKLDPGEKFPWKKLSKFNIGYWYKQNKTFIATKNSSKINQMFFKNIYKIGYRYFKIKKRLKSDRLIVKAFQQRYLPNKVTGKIDEKTFKISHYLAKFL